MERHLIAYYFGISIIIFLHAYILYKPTQQLMTMEQHAYINLIGVMLIAYYFMNKENYISY